MRLLSRIYFPTAPYLSSIAPRGRNALSFSTTTDFGFKDVDAKEKERLVREVFSKVASKYDVMNDLMSFGAHRLWKDELVGCIGFQAAARVNSDKLPRHLDVAGGTGDVAFRSLNAMGTAYGSSFDAVVRNMSSKNDVADGQRQVVVCDINPEMLAVGKSRAPVVLGAAKSSMVCHIIST